MAVEIRTATDIGQVRENNEDSLWAAPGILVVCDGMGDMWQGRWLPDWQWK